MAEKFTRWDAVDYLATEEDMALYLDACLDEDPGAGYSGKGAQGRAQEVGRGTGGGLIY